MSKSHSIGKWQRQNLDLVSLTLWTPWFFFFFNVSSFNALHIENILVAQRQDPLPSRWNGCFCTGAMYSRN